MRAPCATLGLISQEVTLMARANDGNKSGKGHASEKQGMSGEALKKGQSAGGTGDRKSVV